MIVFSSKTPVFHRQIFFLEPQAGEKRFTASIPNIFYFTKTKTFQNKIIRFLWIFYGDIQIFQDYFRFHFRNTKRCLFSQKLLHPGKSCCIIKL